MALVTIASSTTTASVIGGKILSQLSGRWSADLRIDQPGASLFTAGTKVTIASENGYQRSGVIDPYRTGSRVDAVHVRVQGGANGIFNTASARSFVQPGAFVRDVVNGLMKDSGETLDSTTSQSFLSTNLTAWSTIGGNSVARNLKILLKIIAPTFNWRILANGNLWIGAETWPAASATYDVVDFDPTDQSWLIRSESPFIVPGTNLANVGNVAQVLDVIDDGRMRTRVWVDIPGTKRGFIDATQQMALQALPGVDYYALYVCQVQGQSSDLTTVDLAPQGARNKSLIGGLQRVPVRAGQGIKIQFTLGSTALLGWDGGNPASPYAIAGLSGDSPLSIALADSVGDALTLGNGQAYVKAGGSAQVSATATGLTLGTNMLATPVLTVGSVDSLGVPVTNAPTNTGTVLAG